MQEKKENVVPTWEQADKAWEFIVNNYPVDQLYYMLDGVTDDPGCVNWDTFADKEVQPYLYEAAMVLHRFVNGRGNIHALINDDEGPDFFPEKEKNVMEMFIVEFRYTPAHEWSDEGLVFPTAKKAKEYIELLTNGGDRHISGVQVVGTYRITPIQKENPFMDIYVDKNNKEVKTLTLYTYEIDKLISKELGVYGRMLVMTNTPTPEEMVLVNRYEELRKDHHIIKAEMILHKEITGVNLKAPNEPCFRLKGIGDTFHAAWLQYFVAAKGYDFRVERIKLKEQQENGEVVDLFDAKGLIALSNRIRRSTRAWASSTALQILFIKGISWEEFDTKLDMITGFSPKQSKRENENSRITELYAEGSMRDLSIKILEDHPVGDEAYDGHSIVSESFVIRHIYNIGRENAASASRTEFLLKNTGKKSADPEFDNIPEHYIFRLQFDDGLIKGDCTVVPDIQIINEYNCYFDVITHPCNIKPEKGMGANRWFSTLTPHHNHSFPLASQQTMSWALGFLVTEKRLISTMNSVCDEFITSIEEGRYPAHLMQANEYHDDEGKLNLGDFQDSLQNAYHRYTTAMPLNTSSYLMGRAAQGFLNKMEKMRMKGAMPMPWSSYMHVITHAMLEAGGYEIPEEKKDKVFYHKKAGRLTFPAQLFKDIYPNHGGWDEDDSIEANLRVMEDPNGTIVQKEMTFTLKLANTRSPNGLTYFDENTAPGEYSIVDVALDLKVDDETFMAILRGEFQGLTPEGYLKLIGFPLYNVYGGIPVIDMSKAPKNTHKQEITYEELPRSGSRLMDGDSEGYAKKLDKIRKLKAKAAKTPFKEEAETFEAKADEMTKGLENTGPYCVDDAINQLYLAMANPGIGSIINRMISFTVMFNSYPNQLPTRLEQMVDALEQTPDFLAFEIIEEANSYLSNCLVMGARHGRKIDRIIAQTRVSGRAYRALKQADALEEGPFCRMNQAMYSAINNTSKYLTGRDLTGKASTPGINTTQRVVIQELMDVKVTDEAVKLATELFLMFGRERKRAPQDQWYTNADGDRKKYKDPYMAYARREFFLELNAKMMDKVLTSEVPWHLTIVAMYQLIITKGVADDVLFQTSENGTTNGMIDLFIAAMYWYEASYDLFGWLALKEAGRTQRANLRNKEA